MRLAYKVWIDNNGKAFGEGPYDLLKGIEQTGSLRKSAAEIGMSYNQAWRLIRAMEGRLGFPLIRCQAGGSMGGGSEITAEGRRLMDAYGAFREDARSALEQLFGKYFGQLQMPPAAPPED